MIYYNDANIKLLQNTINTECDAILFEDEMEVAQARENIQNTKYKTQINERGNRAPIMHDIESARIDKKILIVDDELFNIVAIKSVLEGVFNLNYHDLFCD